MMNNMIKVVVGEENKLIDKRFFESLDEALAFSDNCLYDVGITRNNDSEFYNQNLRRWEPITEDDAD